MARTSDCSLCGTTFDSGEKECPHCGTENATYVDPQIALRTEQSNRATNNGEPYQQRNTSFNQTQPVTKNSEISIGWLIFWIIFFWPGAIIYLILKKS